LIATEQVRGGDLVRVDYDDCSNRLTFFKEAEDMPAYAMLQVVDTPAMGKASPVASIAAAEAPRLVKRRAHR
jgi:hypothetical protein